MLNSLRTFAVLFVAIALSVTGETLGKKGLMSLGTRPAGAGIRRGQRSR